MTVNRIRPLALAIIWKERSILVFEGYDPLKGETFYRPLGGGIEFGEYGHEALAREFREEINAELTAVRYIATIENVFTYDGQVGHEIVLLYEAEIADRSLYDQECLVAQDEGQPIHVLWKHLDELTDAGPPLYPDGLYELLMREGHS